MKVAWRVVEGEGVLLHAETSAYYGLNRVGTLLWEQLAAQPLSPDELTDWIARAAQRSPELVRSDVQAFVDHLVAMDLVEARPVDGRPAEVPVPAEASGLTYEAPLLMPFGELEKLILSGE